MIHYRDSFKKGESAVEMLDEIVHWEGVMKTMISSYRLPSLGFSNSSEIDSDVWPLRFMLQAYLFTNQRHNKTGYLELMRKFRTAQKRARSKVACMVP